MTSNRVYYILFSVAVCALVVPLFLVKVPPLVDLPNHLARIFILANYDHVPFFQENFKVIYQPIPNVGQDLIVVPLMKVVDIWTANRLFLILCVVIFAVACHLIANHRNGARSFSAIHAAFLIFGWTFFYGFVNYVFAVALFLLAFGLWLRWRQKMSCPKYLLLGGLTFAVYLSHLSAIAFFGLAIVFIHTYEWFFCKEDSKKLWIVAADLSLFIVPLAAFFAFMGGAGKVGKLSWYISEKVLAFPGPFRSYDIRIDLLCIVVPILLYWMLHRRGLLAFDRKLLALGAVFLFIYAIAPFNLFTWDADKRILLPGFVFLILAIRISGESAREFLVYAAVLGLLIFRQGFIAYKWIELSNDRASEIALFDKVVPESKIYPLQFFENNGPISAAGYQQKFSCHLLTMRNNSFAADLWAYSSENALNFRETHEFAPTDDKDRTKWLTLIKDYDYVWAYNAPNEIVKELEQRGTVVGESGKTKVWRLNK